MFIPPKPPQLLCDKDMNHFGPSITSHWEQVGPSRCWEKTKQLISCAPKKWTRNTGHDPYCSVCVCSGCQSQKRAFRNPYRNNHHSICCRAEEVQIPLILHPKPLAEVWGQCNARNSLKRTSLSSCALASAQQRHCSSVRGTRAARRMRMSEESSSRVKLAV